MTALNPERLTAAEAALVLEPGTGDPLLLALTVADLVLKQGLQLESKKNPRTPRAKAQTWMCPGPRLDELDLKSHEVYVLGDLQARQQEMGPVNLYKAAWEGTNEGGFARMVYEELKFSIGESPFRYRSEVKNPFSEKHRSGRTSFWSRLWGMFSKKHFFDKVEIAWIRQERETLTEKFSQLEGLLAQEDPGPASSLLEELGALVFLDGVLSAAGLDAALVLEEREGMTQMEVTKIVFETSRSFFEAQDLALQKRGRRVPDYLLDWISELT